MQYYLKRYLPVVKNPQKIKIGVKSEGIIVENTPANIVLLEKLIETGISEEDIANEAFFGWMKEKEMLTPTMKGIRKELFLEYMGVPLERSILSKKLLILGAGGMGSTTAFMLAQFGFKDLTIVDYDGVEESEIEKMMVYRREHLGQQKTDALKQILEGTFDYCNVKTIEQKIRGKEDIFRIIEESDPEFVIKAMDPKDVGFRLWLNEICFHKQIPFVNNSYSFEFIRLGPLFAPGITDACDNCCNLWFMKGQGADADFNASEKLFHSYTIHPAISFNINIAASLAVKDIIFFFAKKYEYVSSFSKVVDFKSLELQGEVVEITRHPACKICSEVELDVRSSVA